jgi:hypothetical protein
MQVELPVMSISAGLDVALSNLRSSRKSALLSEDNGAYHLFTAGSIVVGRSRGIKTLAELKIDPRSASPQLVVTVPTKTKTQQIGGSQSHRLRRGGTGTTKPTGPTEDIGGGNYVLNSIVGGTAFIGLFDMDLVNKYVSSPPDCYCDGPRQHDTFSVVVRDGDPCPYKDGHKIVCAR